MTPEQRERAREMIETAAGAKEKSAAGIRKFQQRRDNEVAYEREADAAALRAVLEMLEEPVGYVHVHMSPYPDESGLRVWVPDQYAEDSAEAASARCRGHFPVVALLPVRKGGE